MARTAILKTSAGDILFRFPDPLEVWEIYETVPVGRPEAEGAGKMDSPPDPSRLQAVKAALEQHDRLLILCAKKPILVREKCISDEAQLDISDLASTERAELVTQLLDLAGLKKAPAEDRDSAPLVVGTEG